MRKFNLLAKLLFPAFLIFPYFAQAEMPINQSDLVSKSATWRYKPNFSYIHMPDCLPYEYVKVTVNLTVDAQGNVIKTALARSSGDRKTDNYVMYQVKRAKFYPFQKDGKPVIAHGPLTISIECPPPPSPAEIEDQKKQAILQQEILRQLNISNNSSNNSTIK